MALLFFCGSTARAVNGSLKTVNLQTMDRFTGIHAVREALEAGSAFDRIVIAKGRQDSRIEEIVQLARERGISVRFEDRGQLDRLANSRDHQGVVAIAASRETSTLEDILANANSAKNQAGLIVLLDGVEDPHNLGAVIRTALAAGAHGVVIPERRAAGLTDTVARASAGAIAHLPIAKVTNLVRAMEELKEAGYWLVGLDEEGKKSYTEVDYTSPTANCDGQRRKRSARTDAQALRFCGFAADQRSGEVPECFRGDRRGALRGVAPAWHAQEVRRKAPQRAISIYLSY